MTTRQVTREEAERIRIERSWWRVCCAIYAAADDASRNAWVRELTAAIKAGAPAKTRGKA